MPRPYPSEFRERALELVRSGRTVVDVAAALGMARAVPSLSVEAAGTTIGARSWTVLIAL